MTTTSDSAATTSKSLWRLSGLTVWQLARNAFAGLRRNDAIGRASQLAFDFLFALFPLILLIVTMFGIFTSRSVELRNDFLSYFSNFLPPGAFEVLRTTTDELAMNASGGEFTFGVAAVIWFASGGIASMITALNLAYQMEETRSWFKIRSTAIVLTLVMSALLVMALLLVLVSGDVFDSIGERLRLGPVVVELGKILQWPTAIVFVMLSFSLIYYAGPTLMGRRWHWVTPGSAFGTGLWILASLGFRTYLHYYNTYSTTYGSLGAVMILLAWLYVSGLSFLIGGEINAELERACTNCRELEKLSAPDAE